MMDPPNSDEHVAGKQKRRLQREVLQREVKEEKHEEKEEQERYKKTRDTYRSLQCMHCIRRRRTPRTITLFCHNSCRGPPFTAQMGNLHLAMKVILILLNAVHRLWSSSLLIGDPQDEPEESAPGAPRW